MNNYENAYNSLIDSTSSYHDVILSFDDGGKIYSSKYFLSYISPVLEKIFKYDKNEDNIYHFPHKKTESIRTIIALSFPFIDITKLLNEIKINPEITNIIDEWCMTDLWENIESFFLTEYENYKLGEILYFAHKCNFKKVTEKIINNMTINKYNLIKESKVWEKINDSIKITLSESVMNNLKKRKFSCYD